jgi:hypothetical protein
MSRENDMTTIELAIQNYIEDIQNYDNQVEILYIFALVEYPWEPNFGLNTIKWNKVKLLNFVAITHLEFTICPQIKFDSNAKGRIINYLAVQWIWFRKHYFRICRGEKLRKLVGER